MTDKPIEAQIAALKEAAEKAAPGPWKAFNMTDVDGAPMSAQEIGQYVTNSILKSVEDGGFEDQFLFISEPDCGGPDICHVGNGPNGPNNANFLERANPATILALLAEREALREALKYYAKQHEFPNEGPWGVNSDDFGNRARKALGDKP